MASRTIFLIEFLILDNIGDGEIRPKDSEIRPYRAYLSDSCHAGGVRPKLAYGKTLPDRLQKVGLRNSN